jgi:protein transport protein SEC61 subunit gamma-like protein
MNMKNTIMLTKKSDKEVYMQHLRLVLFGIATIGAIGFGIQFIFSVLTFGR